VPVNPQTRRTALRPILLPDELAAIEFYFSLSPFERQFVKYRSRKAIRFIAMMQQRPHSEVASLLMKAFVTLKKFEPQV
jgi:hypothetical protein